MEKITPNIIFEISNTSSDEIIKDESASIPAESDWVGETSKTHSVDSIAGFSSIGFSDISLFFVHAENNKVKPIININSLFFTFITPDRLNTYKYDDFNRFYVPVPRSL